MSETTLYLPPGVQRSAVISDARFVAEQADVLLQRGETHAGRTLMQKAISMGTNETVTLEFDSPGAPEVLNAVDSDLMKALAANAISPNPTPCHINESLLYLGAYNGIKDLATATGMTHRFLRQVARSPFVKPIISGVANAATMFTTPQPAKSRTKGFRVRMRNENANVSRAAEKRIHQIENLLLHGGFVKQPNGMLTCNDETGEPGVWDGRNEEQALGLYQTTKIMVENSSAMDWASLRVEPGDDERSYPVAFFNPIDADKVLLTHPNYVPRIAENRGKRIRAIEVGPDYNQVMPLREYTWDRIATMVRNPRTDFYGRGYGLSETEIAVEVIANLMRGVDFESSYFDKNYIPPCIISLIGNTREISPAAMATFKNQMHHSLGGQNGAWKAVLLAFNPGQGTGIKVDAVRSQVGGPAELQAATTWLTFLIAMLCSIYQVNAEEINFPSFSNQTSSIGNGPDAQTKLDHSKDKSLLPTMVALRALYNKTVVYRYDPDFELEWTGLEAHSEKEHLENLMARLNLGEPLNSIRDSEDEPRLKIAVEPDILNAALAKQKREDYDTDVEFNDAVNKAYEQAFRKAVPDESVSPWSKVPDMPLAPTAQQQWSGEQAALAGARQQAQQEDLMREQGMSDDDIAQMKLGAVGDPNDPNQQGAPGGSGGQGGDPLGNGQERHDQEDPFGWKGQDDDKDEYDEDGKNPHAVPEDDEGNDDDPKRNKFKRRAGDKGKPQGKPAPVNKSLAAPQVREIVVHIKGAK